MTRQVEIFLADYEGLLLFAVLVLSLVVAAVAEGRAPLRDQSRDQLGRRWTSNLSLLVIGQVNATWVVAVSALALEASGIGEGFGLAPQLGLGFWSSFVLAFLLFELVNYWFHRALHALPWLWPIHAVHHCDTELDCSTTFRNHPLELLVIAPITVPLVYLLGFPAESVVLFQLVRTAILVFVHSNVQFPENLDRRLRLIIGTPDFHRVHHAAERPLTDSNFSTILPLYDYLFGTYRDCARSRLVAMRIGLEYLDRPADSRLDRLLLLPFFWRRMVPEKSSGSNRGSDGEEAA